MDENVLSNGTIPFHTCFFCEERCVDYKIHDMYPEMKIAASSIGRKIICSDCSMDIYSLMGDISGAEDELIEEEETLQEQGV